MKVKCSTGGRIYSGCSPECEAAIKSERVNFTIIGFANKSGKTPPLTKWLILWSRPKVIHGKMGHPVITLRDAGMELDNMSNTTQLFLGTQMVCAQCHNHPFDKWTQREYYEMAAFTYGITTRMGGQLQNDLKTHFNQVNKKSFSSETKAKGPIQAKRSLEKGSAGDDPALRYGSRHTARQLTLPHDYQYDDAQPESRVSPAPIFGESLGVENADDKIEAYGQWLTSSENPRFTKVIANRMWKKIFGRGLVEPVDDWRDDTQASIPELLDHLEKLMVRVNYDLKEFQRCPSECQSLRS